MSAHVPPQPPEGWKSPAWDLHPPEPGDPDYGTYKALVPKMIEYHAALIEASEAAPELAPRPFFDGERHQTPEWPEPEPEPEPGPEPDPESGDPGPAPGPEHGRAKAGPSIYTVRELAALPSADEEYIVGDGVLTRGGKLLIVAKSGHGKTTLLHDLAGCLAMGRPWLGRYAIDRPRRVMVVQGELSLPEMASHAQQLMAAGYDAEGLLFARMTDLRLPEGEATLRALIAAAEADVVALDPWYRLFAGESSNAAEQVDTVFKVCDRLLEDGTLEAVIVVHHTNVTGLRTAGSWVFEGWPSTIIRLDLVPGVTDQRLLAFDKVRAPSSSLLGQQFQVRLGETGYLPVLPTRAEAGAGPTLAVHIVTEAGGQLHRADLVARLMVRAACRERAAAKYLGEAVQHGRLRKVQDGKSMLYQLATEEGR